MHQKKQTHQSEQEVTIDGQIVQRKEKMQIQELQRNKHRNSPLHFH